MCQALAQFLCHIFSCRLSVSPCRFPKVRPSISKTGSRQSFNGTTPLDFREIADICPFPFLTQSLSFFATPSLSPFHIWDSLILLGGIGFKHAHFSKHTLRVRPLRSIFCTEIISILRLWLQSQVALRHCTERVGNDWVLEVVQHSNSPWFQSKVTKHTQTHSWRGLGLCGAGADAGWDWWSVLSSLQIKRL